MHPDIGDVGGQKMYDILKRLFDTFLAMTALLTLIPMLFIISLAVKFTSPGPVLYWSDRVGKNNKIFKMPKFRTMRANTPELATHLLDNPDQYLTSIGSFLRTTSIDELPQLYSILKGDMSFVGPRPALFNQYDLIEARTKSRIDILRPGLTGWAQINGRDELTIEEKVRLDRDYLFMRSLYNDFFILWQTFIKVIKKDDVKH